MFQGHQVIKPQLRGRKPRIARNRFDCAAKMIRNLSDQKLEEHVRTARDQKMLQLYIHAMEDRRLIYRPQCKSGVHTAFLVRIDQWTQLWPKT